MNRSSAATVDPRGMGRERLRTGLGQKELRQTERRGIPPRIRKIHHRSSYTDCAGDVSENNDLIPSLDRKWLPSSSRACADAIMGIVNGHPPSLITFHPLTPWFLLGLRERLIRSHV